MEINRIYNDGTTTDLTSVTNSSSVLPKLLNQNSRLGLTLPGNFLKQDKIAYYHGAIINIYIVYKLPKRTVSSPDFTVQNAVNIWCCKNKQKMQKLVIILIVVMIFVLMEKVIFLWVIV